MGKNLEINNIDLNKQWTIEQIIESQEELNISAIAIAKDIDRQNKVEKRIVADKQHPFIIKGSKLEINEDYFLEHSQEIHNLITTLCSKAKDIVFEIKNKELIPENIIETAINNKNINELDLVPASGYEKELPEEQQYILTEEDYKKIKSSSHPISVYTSNVVEELKDNFDPIIKFNRTKSLIRGLTYDQLQQGGVFLDDSTSDEELQNLKYVNPNGIISICSPSNEFIEKVLKIIQDLQLNQKLFIEVTDKEKFNQSNIFKDSIYENLNIFINYETQTIPLGLYKKTEQTMYMFLSPLKDKNYSPFEKFIYVYNMTKNFKQYKEVEDNRANIPEYLMVAQKSQSRYLHEILFNDYMVCVGYAKMLIDFLHKIGIQTTDQGIDVAINDEGEELKTGGHARVISHIVDPKYNIDGYYISDPTLDNNIELDFYNHLALTSKEVNSEHRKHMGGVRKTEFKILQDSADIIFSESLDEFYDKINYIINKKINKYISDCKNKNEVYDIKNEVVEIYIRILNDILMKVKEIDEEKYKEITSKYEIPKTKFDAKDGFIEEFSQIITELANYIVPMTNKVIPASTIIDAAMVVNKDALNLSDKKAEAYRKYLININHIMQQYFFPQRTIENATTGEVIYQNEENKFDSIYPQNSGKTL